ncbi:MAG: T9SS type A sorting domain-containing protein, partial [Bacteroidetes bacterium]|nr:T9SS type A sorting domain-containing protein [Bacteroidota bacterium]
NGGHGILVGGEIPEAPFPNVIQGNRIGTNAGGTAPLGNGGYGVALVATTAQVIGGDDGLAPPACAGACNLIAGNGLGGIGLLRTTGGIVRGNAIGTDRDGAAPLPNAGPGIDIVGSSDNLFERNTIAFNEDAGISLQEIGSESIPADRNAILDNRLFENAGLGIDLFGDGVTPNGNNFSTGPNDLQEFPVLTSVQFDGTTTTIEGFLQSEADAFYMIELFANDTPDPTKHGEGQMPLGGLQVTTEATGRAGFTFTTPGEALNVTATATDGTGNTSEFSRLAGGLIVNDPRDLGDLDPQDGLCDADPADGDQCTLRAAIQQANAQDGRDEITFELPTDQPTIIEPTAPLPPIEDPVDLDGTTQAGTIRCFPQAGGLPVELSGTLLPDGPSAHGLVLGSGSDGSSIRGLTINRFPHSGIHIQGSSGNAVTCTFVGTDTQGETPEGNGVGISIDAASSGNVIGGAAFADRTLISGNTGDGIRIAGADNRVLGTLIGTDKGGTQIDTDGDPDSFNPISNGASGIAILDGANDTVIGGAEDGAGNVIGGNGLDGGAGIRVEGSGNRILGNHIGIGEEGETDLHNFGHGIHVLGGSNNEIGADGAGNTIAFNDAVGIRVEPTASRTPVGNTIRGNALFRNRGLGIDLGDLAQSGVTPNDPGDGDEGANTLINFPVLGTLERDPASGDVSFEVTLDLPSSRASATVEYFASTGCDALGHGEGAVSLGTRAVELQAGRATVAHVLSGVPQCRFVTATVTDADGNTSEFSECAVRKAECLDITEVQFWHQPPGVGEPFETRRTTDGNRMEIRTLVQNNATTPLTADLTVDELEGGHALVEPEATTFPPEQLTTLSHDWNTGGFAWEIDVDPNAPSRPQATRRVRTSLLDDQGLVDEEEVTVTVRPRPVVLVHGLWADHATWDTFKPFFGEERADWERGAVGDGLHPGTMETGVFPLKALQQSVDDGPFALSLVHTTTTIAENAEALNQYVESIREDEEAVHVDLVAHSMGGLISRYYVDALMPPAPPDDPDPVVRHLVMLGTPNLGSPCADLWLGIISQPREFLARYAGPFKPLVDLAGEALEETAATNVYQLTPEYVRGTFNREVTAQRGVPYYIYAGTPLPVTCTALNAGDEVVERTSAFMEGSTGPTPTFEQKQRTTLLHTAMPQDRADAFDFVRAILDRHPAEQEAGLPEQLLQMHGTPDAQREEPQIIASGLVPVLPGEPVSIAVPVAQASAFGITLVGDATLTSALVDPEGTTVERTEAGTTGAATLFRTHAAMAPAGGTWTLELGHTSDTDTLYVPIGAWAYGTPVQLGTTLGTPDASGRIPVQAAFTDGGTPIPDAAVTARAVAAAGGASVVEVELFDDGAHQDEAAGDGIYGGVLEALPSASYTVGVWAARGDTVRGTSTVVEVSSDPAGPDLGLEAPAAQAVVGTPLTYAVQVGNTGVGAASEVVLSGVLPGDLTVEGITPAHGTCAQDEQTIICEIGQMDAGADTEVTLTLVPEALGVSTVTLSVGASEADWNPGNNTRTVVIDVSEGTATEDETRPDVFQLHPNYPNPFNPTTTIRYDVSAPSPVTLEVLDVLGRRVALLVDEVQRPGRHRVRWRAGALPGGVYFVRMQADAFSAVRQVVLAK